MGLKVAHNHIKSGPGCAKCITAACILCLDQTCILFHRFKEYRTFEFYLFQASLVQQDYIIPHTSSAAWQNLLHATLALKL
jgi:hypothetical protein